MMGLSQLLNCTIKCILSLATIVLVLGIRDQCQADLFHDELGNLQQQKQQEIGRTATVAAYERLIADHRGHPDLAWAMLELASNWQNKIPELDLEPDYERADFWIEQAYEAAPMGREVWFDATFRYAYSLFWKDPERAELLLQMIYNESSDAAYQTKTLRGLQTIANHRRDLARAEKICFLLQRWVRDKKDLPTDSFRLGEVFSNIQESANLMMVQYAQLNEPQARRIARMDELINKHVKVGRYHAGRNRDQLISLGMVR